MPSREVYLDKQMITVDFQPTYGFEPDPERILIPDILAVVAFTSQP